MYKVLLLILGFKLAIMYVARPGPDYCKGTLQIEKLIVNNLPSHACLWSRSVILCFSLFLYGHHCRFLSLCDLIHIPGEIAEWISLKKTKSHGCGHV